MARRAHWAKRGRRFFRDHEVGGHDTGTGGAQRGIQRVAIHRRIGIEVHRALFRCHVADRAHAFERMRSGKLLVGRERRLVRLHVRGDSRGDQLIVDCGEARGLFGMVRAHVVPEAVGMRDKGGRHDERSYPIEYNRRMLLSKAELPQNIVRGPIDRAIESAGRIILGKEGQVRLALACLLARGHLLIEDLPGVGKTTLAHVLARSLGLQFQRIQFTSDMLPADIIGVSIYERDSGNFKFHPGPIFAQVILADEVTRATPKTQSALLEAMEEHQVTAEGETRKLPEPFFVIATQNPSEQVGTFPLPDPPPDRFMMRIELGYPDREAERALLSGTSRRDILATLSPCMTPAELMELQGAA